MEASLLVFIIVANVDYFYLKMLLVVFIFKKKL